MAELARARPTTVALGPIAWARANLFNTPGNSIITLVVLAALFWIVPKIFAWAITDDHSDRAAQYCRPSTIPATNAKGHDDNP